MPKCNCCGNKGSTFDSTKFMRHGFSTDSFVRLSRQKCHSHNISNTAIENTVYYLEWGILIILFAWLLIPFYFISKFNSNSD